MAITVLRARNLAVGTKFGLETGSLPSGVLALEATSDTNTNTALNTVGAAVLTAAALNGGIITRGGTQIAAFTDTTDTAAALQAIYGDTTGGSIDVTINNNTAFAETIAGGTGVTVSGLSVIPANSVGNFRLSWSAAGAVSMVGTSVAANGGLPVSKVSTPLNQTTGSLPAGAITGAQNVYITSSNATPGAQLVRTAAQMLADTPNGAVGMTWNFRILNTGAGTLTLTADGGATVTLSGTMTVAQNTWRDFSAVFNTATTATITSVGAGVV